MGKLNGLLFIAVIVLAAAQIYTIQSMHSMEARLKASTEAELAKTRDEMNASLAKMKEVSATDAAAREKSIAEMREEMDQAKRQARGVAGRVKQEALKNMDELTSRVDANEKKLRDQQAAIASELTGVKQTASSTQSNVAAVSTEVREVRTDVANSRTQLDRAVMDLRRMTGDMGVMSGLIATNQKEISALRTLGDRNYTEFSIAKGKDAVQVADIWVVLKKADANRRKFTLELRSDDQKIEKRDRTANEPVQFYVGRNKQPHELVVNQVAKDRVTGYLATPKAGAQRP